MRRETGWVFALMTLAAAVLAPAAGLVVAQVENRRKVRARFLVMATVSGGPILLFLFLAVLYPECPDGYHC
ncbi:hypothetical protein [Streptomyces aurantiacus]|uniref:hypothetical protein n=1 Tax=Streptomyces aurantiacus TaxID=47760 RepID=UPI0027D926A3|nr:hypothetical protein [Streptomyces aurantiacus]